MALNYQQSFFTAILAVERKRYKEEELEGGCLFIFLNKKQNVMLCYGTVIPASLYVKGGKKRKSVLGDAPSNQNVHCLTVS